MIEDSYTAGYPLRDLRESLRPSRSFTTGLRTIIWTKNTTGNIACIYKRPRQDYENNATAYSIRLQGRVKWEPFGWLDERAKDQKELKVFQYSPLAPRDLFGNVLAITSYIDPNKDDLFLMYINSFRRIRKMTASDMQDPAVGQDMIYEDWQDLTRS
jgi:hypothetical protein